MVQLNVGTYLTIFLGWVIPAVTVESGYKVEWNRIVDLRSNFHSLILCDMRLLCEIKEIFLLLILEN